MYSSIQPNYDGMLASHLSRMEADDAISDKADEMIGESILDDIMYRLSPQAQREVRNIVLEMAEADIKAAREADRQERLAEVRYCRDNPDY